MPISSNRRQRVIEYATPKVADLVVVERVDASRIINASSTADDTAYGTAHPDTTRFPNFKLALIKNSGSSSSSQNTDQGQFQDWYYVKDRDNQDDYNWEFQAAGANNPHYDTVVRTYVTLRSAFKPEDPEITEEMPITESDPFDGSEDYILFEKKQTRSGDEFLDTLYVVEQHVYVKRVPMWRVDTDPEFPDHDALISKETLWYVGEQPLATRTFEENESLERVDSTPTTPELFANSAATIDVTAALQADGSETTNFWGVDKHGVLREGKQLTDNWFAIIEKQVVGAVGKLSEIETYQSFSWPAVLDGVTTATTSDDLADGEEDPSASGAAGDNKGGILVHSWTRRKGGADTTMTPIFKRQAWSGPTRMVIERFWQKGVWAMGTNAAGTDTELAKIIPMLPEPVNFLTPIVSMRVGSCLHTRIHVWATSGTDHEIWKYSGSSFTFDRTNYEDWPACHVVSDTQAPFRGGYLRERTRVHSPEVTNSTGACPT